MISIFQIYFDAISKAKLEEGFIPYENLSKDGYFENTVILDIYNKLKKGEYQDSKYIGFCSWKMNKKTNLTGKEVIDVIKKDIYLQQEKDVYIFSPIDGIEPTFDITKDPSPLHATINFPTIWQQHKDWGPRPYDADVMLEQSNVLPFKILNDNWVYCHCNYFAAEKSVFIDYCEKVLLPFFNFFERPEIKSHPVSEAWYTHLHEKIKYPSYSFVAEGLFGSFLANNNYSYEYICKRRRRKKLCWIRIDGYKVQQPQTTE